MGPALLMRGLQPQTPPTPTPPAALHVKRLTPVREGDRVAHNRGWGREGSDILGQFLRIELYFW